MSITFKKNIEKKAIIQPLGAKTNNKKSDPAASNICKIRPFRASSGTRTLDK